VGVAVDAAERLARPAGAGAPGLATRVVSMPAPQLFAQQDEAWRRHLLPPGGRRVSIEAGVTEYWRAIVGERGLAIGVDRYGESAPAEVLAGHFGLTGEAVAKRVRDWAPRA
jgi:transketolase